MIIGSYTPGTNSSLITGKFSPHRHEALLLAIRGQRWFHFRKRDGIVFDSRTGLVWNTDFGIPYQKEGTGTYKREEALEIMKTLYLHGIATWNFPTENQYKLLVSELGISDFPYSHHLQFPPIFRAETGMPLPQLESGSLLLCSESYFTQNYKEKVQEQFPEYSSQFTLELFLSHRLVPEFTEEKANILYREALEEYKTSRKLLTSSSNNHVSRLIFTFHPKEVLSRYPCEEIDKSFLQYAASVKSASNLFLEKLTQYEEVNEEFLAEFQSIRLKLRRKYQYSAYLTQEENSQLATQGEFFQKHFAFGTEGVRRQLLAIQAQGLRLEESVEEINQTEQSIVLLAELEQEKRVSFALLLENMSNILCKSIEHMEFFQQHRDFVNSSLTAWEEFQEDYKALKKDLFSEFSQQCEDENIPQKLSDAWLLQWGTLRFSVEKLLTPLLEFALQGHLLEKDKEGITPVEDLVALLSDYKAEADRFFMKNRIPLEKKHQQLPNPFQADYDEKLKESKEITPSFQAFLTSQEILYEKSCVFLEVFTHVLFRLPPIPCRQFLLQWVKPIFSIQVEGVLQFLSTQAYTEENQIFLRNFSLLKQESFQTLLYDKDDFIRSLDERGRDISIFFQELKEYYDV